MRALIIAPVVIALVLLISRMLSAVTGDPLSAIVIELIAFIAAAGWLAGSPEQRAPVGGGR